MRSGGSIFKKFRIAHTLLKSSFKSILFDHQHYFLFCILLAAMQFIHLKIAGLLHHGLKLSVLMTELLAGENFFEIFWHDTYFTVSANNFWTLFIFIVVLYLQIILIFFVLSAVSHYTFKQQNNSLQKSIQTSLTHWRIICVWGLFELSAQGLSSLLGYIGMLLYFLWNIITIFDVQIVSFDRIGAYHVLKKSWKLFKQNVSGIVVLDILIEGSLIIAGVILYFILRRYVTDLSFIESVNYNNLVVFLILYLISSVMVLEVIVFTNFYKAIEKRTKI